MKRFLIISTFIGLAMMACAQTRPRQHKDVFPAAQDKIENIISNLSLMQKTSIDIITKRSAKVIENYKTQLKTVRDSIRSLMDSPEDHCKTLFPLFEKEGELQAELSKEYYRTKVAIDKILSPEQYKELQAKMKEKHQKRLQQRDKARESKHLKGDSKK